MEIRKAQRKKAKLRLALMGASGSGKTYSALELAFGLGGKVGLIDTEHGSGELYADMGAYDVIQLDAPYTVTKYRQAMKAFEDAGYSSIIIDSLTHAWAGEGGLLDKQGKLEMSGKYKNSFLTWKEITPEHNLLIEEMLNSPCHIIATMRSKTEYVIEKDEKGKQIPRKIGLAPVQREGMEYEMTVVLDIADNHFARATKDRTGLFRDFMAQIDKSTGKMLADWLEQGTEPEVSIETWAKQFAFAVDNTTSQMQLTELIAEANPFLLKLKEKKPDWLEKLMLNINQAQEAFRLADAS